MKKCIMVNVPNERCGGVVKKVKTETLAGFKTRLPFCELHLGQANAMHPWQKDYDPKG